MSFCCFFFGGVLRQLGFLKGNLLGICFLVVFLGVGSSVDVSGAKLPHNNRQTTWGFEIQREDQVIQAVTFSSPIVGGHLTLKKGSLKHPEKVTD